ncbi:endonuclease III domain-containing protein [Qipengyuania sediminis]|uniref:endonuclease III domain-containing protein n=1 Tax=Qipengyuania sediminis TaxID=1532023 RepID=UPI0010598110|nr:endonuclease III [Qipengyuania sediminis]
MPETGATAALRDVHAALILRFGRRVRSDERRKAPEWMMVQGLIGSRMPSEASSAVADGVLARLGSWDVVAALALDRLTAELKGVRFPNQSAKRVHDVLGAIVAQRGRVDLSHLAAMETGAAMAWLETLPGLGRKIAAQVMNASTLCRRALVLDTHHLRILARMGLIGPRDDTRSAYDHIMPLLPPEWTAADIDEHHALMKELGRTHCKPKTLICETCPALPWCETGRARVAVIQPAAA